MATTSNTFAFNKKNRLSAARRIRPAKMCELVPVRSLSDGLAWRAPHDVFADVTAVIACYYQELMNYFTRVIKDRDSAADIVQEAYLRVLALQADKPVSQPRALLYHTARNLVIDRYRRREIRGEDHHAGDAVAELESVAAPAACEPETAAASAQAVAALLCVIDGLPPRCREAFILHRFDGVPHAEVAARMGISRKTVEQHIKLAMDVCRRCKAQLDMPCERTNSLRKGEQPPANSK
jgi:RNA polymerase sigma factor (sigma-70 family)